MGDVINLRQARKLKARSEKEAQASENRVKFGRTLAQKQLEKTKSANERKALDGHKLSSRADKPQ